VTSISRRLIFWLAIPLMLLALCGALLHYFFNVAPGVISSDRRLREAANVLMERVQVKNGQVTLDMAEKPARPLPSADAFSYVLRDTQGHLILGDSRLPVIAMNSEDFQLITLTPLDQRNVRTLVTRFDTSAGVIIITVCDLRPSSEREARLGLINTLLWDFVQLDVTLILVWFGIRLGLRPVRQLRADIADRSPQDLRPIDLSWVPREIAPVVVTLNRLFSTLRASVQAQQQFIANTAHQLRTPITGIQAQLDVLAGEPAAAAIRDRLAVLQESAKHLAHAANQLLMLARADPGANMAAKNETIDLRAMAAEVAAKFFDRALQLNIDLGIDAQAAPIVADPSLIDDLLSNLVDNALKYTPAGGKVTIITGQDKGRSFLIVEDSGPGIPESERRRVRQRFYRLPNSSGHGSGLGLAIVDEIANLYAATLVIEAGANGVGTRVAVRF
jgi:two-component system, OmpR family, sensor histidine kinase TctE